MRDDSGIIGIIVIILMINCFTLLDYNTYIKYQFGVKMCHECLWDTGNLCVLLQLSIILFFVSEQSQEALLLKIDKSNVKQVCIKNLL